MLEEKAHKSVQASMLPTLKKKKSIFNNVSLFKSLGQSYVILALF